MPANAVSLFFSPRRSFLLTLMLSSTCHIVLEGGQKQRRQKWDCCHWPTRDFRGVSVPFVTPLMTMLFENVHYTVFQHSDILTGTRCFHQETFMGASGNILKIYLAIYDTFLDPRIKKDSVMTPQRLHSFPNMVSCTRREGLGFSSAFPRTLSKHETQIASRSPLAAPVALTTPAAS